MQKIAVFKLAFINFWMSRFIPIIHKIIAVLQNNKMNFIYRELREKFSDMAKNVSKLQKSTRLLVRLYVKEIESTCI